MIANIRRFVASAFPDDIEAAAGAYETPRRQRLVAALVIALAAGVCSLLLAQRPGAVPDFFLPHTAARFFLAGSDPYQAMRGDASAAPPFDEPLYFPFTTVLLVAPMARFPAPLAAALFFGFSSGLLAWFITRRDLWRLHVFASAPFMVATALAQFSPLVTVMAFAPAAGFLAAVKPNIGVALLARRPSVRALAGCGLLIAISVALLPHWPGEWLDVVRHDVTGRQVHEIPALQLGGILLLLSAVAWRRPAGRLLLVLSLAPQLLFFYDQLPLWLIPRTRGESIALTACSQLAMILWFVTLRPGDPVVRSAAPYVLALVYLPALLLVLRARFARPAPPGSPADAATAGNR